MTVDLDSGTGLFDRMGKLIHLMREINDHLGGGAATDIPQLVDGLADKFDAATNGERKSIEGLQQATDSYQSSAQTFAQFLKSAAEALVIEMVNADDPLPAKSIANAIDTLVRQMNDGSETVNASEPSSVTTADGANDGNGSCVVSLLDDTGATLERMLAEDIKITFSTNTQAVAQGQYAVDVLDHEYPTGSGQNLTIDVIDPTTDGVVNDPGFETWDDASTLTNWSNTGTIARESTTIRNGTYSVKVASSGTPVITQAITGEIEGQTPYVLHLAVRSELGTPTGGNITVSITDGTTILTDEQGVDQSMTIAFGDLSTSWTSFTKILQIADPLPATVEIEIDVDTGFSEAIFLDDCCFGVVAGELYAGGPRLALVEGTTEFGLDDLITVAITNGNTASFQHWFGRLFPSVTKLLPSTTGGTETIPDSLIG